MLFLCGKDREQAQAARSRTLFLHDLRFGHHYLYGEHEPGKTSVWDKYKATPGAGIGIEGTSGAVFGPPQEARDAFRIWEDTGIDQIMLLTQCGNMPQEAACESIELLGREVMPEFKEREEKRLREKAERVAPIIERAMKRKRAPRLPKSTGPTIIKAVGGYGGIIPGISDKKA